jgi:hypothetical protein
VGECRDLIVREWPASWPGTRAAAEHAAATGQLVHARWTVRGGRQVLQVVLRAQAVEPAPRRPRRELVVVGAVGAGAVGTGAAVWAASEWAVAASVGARAAVTEVATTAVAWLTVGALCVAALAALLRSLRD